LDSSEDNRPEPDYERIELKRSDLVRMNIPEDYWKSKVGDIEDEEIRRVITRYLRKIKDMVQDHIGLLLYGQPGGGKTTVATLVAKEARTWKFTAFFSMVWELRECIRSRIPFDEHTSIMDRCREVDVLVLDGISHEDIDDKLFGMQTIEKLVIYRGQRRRITVLTTRLTLHELDKLGYFMQGVAPYLYPLEVEESDDDSITATMRNKVLGEDD